jgi:hypothetical protein
LGKSIFTLDFAVKQVPDIPGFFTINLAVKRVPDIPGFFTQPVWLTEVHAASLADGSSCSWFG